MGKVLCVWGVCVGGGGWVGGRDTYINFYPLLLSKNFEQLDIVVVLASLLEASIKWC